MVINDLLITFVKSERYQECVCISCAPGKRVQGLDEIVTVLLLSAFQQSSSGMNHVTGQEAIFKSKMHTKRLDADVLHTDGRRKNNINASKADVSKLHIESKCIPVFI